MKTNVIIVSIICPVLFMLINPERLSSYFVPDLVSFLHEIDVCISIKNSTGGIIATNIEAHDNTEYCIEISAETQVGWKALNSLSENGIIDGYINGEINIQWSDDEEIYETQILSLMSLYTDLNLGFIAYLKHLYQHWIETYIEGYAVSYKWIDQHYTTSDQIIHAFIDNKYDLYSHGLFNNTDTNHIDNINADNDFGLTEASERKLEAIIRDCDLKPGSKVLDVGSGWGAFLKYAVPRGIHVHSITISNASFAYLTNLVNENKWNNLVNVSLINFWELQDIKYAASLHNSFDAIVCLGTIEHVPYYQNLLEFANVLLKKDGYLYTDGFGTKKGYNSNYFMQKYIYPGDSKPFHASSFFKAWEQSQFRLISVNVDTMSYYKTMISWSRKFEYLIKTNQLNIDTRSYRIFQLYLWGIATAFQPKYDYNTAFRVIQQKIYN